MAASQDTDEPAMDAICRSVKHGQNGRRKWEPIGVICPDEKCRRVILDETGEKEEEG
jgi:hypothetical protein